MMPPAPRLQQVDASAVGPLTSRDKRKRTAKFDMKTPPSVNPESLMAMSKGATREAQAEQVVLERRTEIAASQPCVQEGYTPNPEVA